MDFVELIGFAAAALVFLTFCMQTLLPLRVIATASNILFIAYAWMAGLAPILILHTLLLPVNLWRLFQQVQLRMRLEKSLSHPADISLLMPFMTLETYTDGATLFHEGDPADRLFLIIDGDVRVDGVDGLLGKGSILGEMGLFSDTGRRTAAVHAAGPVSAGWISRPTVIKLFRDHPDFALALTRMMVSRLAENQQALRQRLAP